MTECAFEEYLFKERKKRWETKIEMEKIEQQVSYLLSSDNDACYGKYLNSQSSVLHHCLMFPTVSVELRNCHTWKKNSFQVFILLHCFC